jgi:hypothetical protein
VLIVHGLTFWFSMRMLRVCCSMKRYTPMALLQDAKKKINEINSLLPGAGFSRGANWWTAQVYLWTEL